MYNAQNLAERIKQTAKDKGISLGQMLKQCGLNVNSINQISDKKGIASGSLVLIADYLGVSVDYLLCRSDISDDVVPLLNIYGKLSAVDRAKLLVYADGLLNK